MQGGSVSRLFHASLRGVLALALALPLAGCAGFPGGDPSAGSLREHRAYMAKRAAAEAADVEKEPRSFDETIAAARRFHRNGQVDQAMRLYFDAYRLDPQDPRAQEGIAFLQLDTQAARAERVLKKVAAENPQRSMTQVGLGLARYAQGDAAGAAAALESAVELRPDSADAHESLAVVLSRLGRHGEALIHAERARTLAPDESEIANNLGFSYLMSGDAVRAEENIRDAIALDDSHPLYRNNLAISLGRQGRYDEALHEFRLAGNEQAAHNNIAYLYYLDGRLDEAVSHFETAVLAQGDDTATALRNLNAALNARGERGTKEGR
jgi:Flp pilus assembly protein TadD